MPPSLLNGIADAESMIRVIVIHKVCSKGAFLDFRPIDYQRFQRFAAFMTIDKVLKLLVLIH